MTPYEVLQYSHDNDHPVEIETHAATYEDCEVTSLGGADGIVEFITAGSWSDWNTVVVIVDINLIKRALLS